MADPATDYDIAPEVATLLMGIALLPAAERRNALVYLGRQFGAGALIDAFAQFVGLANSVASNASEHAQNLLVEMGQVHPHTAEQINMPNIVGALQGLQLVPGIDPAPLCHGCAFRKGSIANQCFPTTLDAELCSQPHERPFMCHEDVDEQGKPKCACRGFAQARARNNAAERETP